MWLASFACLLAVQIVTGEQTLFTIPLVPHHVQRERMRRQLDFDDLDGFPRRREEALTVGALYQGYGTHYVDLWVGTPPQRQTVIVDIGSGVTAFPCSGCQDCGDTYHIDKFFIEKDSSTFEKLTCDQCSRGSCSGGECRIGMSYQEGSSWSAYEARDITYAGGLHDEPLDGDGEGDDIDPKHASAFAFPLKFGCQTSITGLFKTQLADGIMGMDNAGTAYWNQMHEAGMLNDRQFSLCYSRQPLAERSGTEAGALTFGGTEDRLHTSPMVYSGGKNGRVGFFSVHMRKIYLREGGGGDSATSTNSKKNVVALDADEGSLNSGGIIVDSGTTDTYYSRSISRAFGNAYKKLTGNAYNHDPVNLTTEQLNALPTILFQIAGDVDSNKALYGDNFVTGLAGEALDEDHPYDIILAMPPSHYMEYDPKREMYVSRFYVDEGGGSVLGGNAIMGHNVFFDLDNNRIGWAESKCDYSDLVKDYDFDAADDSQQESEKSEGTIPTPTKPADDTQPEHETAKHTDNVPGLPSSNVNPIQACSSITCRGAFLASMLGVLLVGIFVGRSISRRSSLEPRYHGTELEVPTLHLDEDDAVDFTSRYRDHPDDEGSDEMAEEGIGYEEDDELDPREIA